MSYTLLSRPGISTPIKAWITGVQIESEAEQQLFNTAQLPIIYKWLAAMPDVHYGIGATVGSVVPTKNAIESVIDETPGAYKDVDAVIAAQSDLVEVVHTIKQVVCVKG